MFKVRKLVVTFSSNFFKWVDFLITAKYNNHAHAMFGLVSLKRLMLMLTPYHVDVYFRKFGYG